MSAVEKAPRPGMFCSQLGATAVDEFGVEVSCTRLEGETQQARARWRRPEEKAGRKARARTGRSRAGGGRRAPSSAAYTGVADISAPTLPLFMPVIQLTQPAPAVADPGDEPLTDQERALLEFELRTQHLSRGMKENAILADLKMSSIKYWQQINQLLNRRATLRAYPQIVSRLDKIRQDSRRW